MGGREEAELTASGQSITAVVLSRERGPAVVGARYGTEYRRSMTTEPRHRFSMSR